MIRILPRSGITLLLMLLAGCGQKHVVVWTVGDTIRLGLFGVIVAVIVLGVIVVTIEHFISTWRERRKKTKGDLPDRFRY